MKYICDICSKYPCSADETKLMLSCPAFSPKPKPITNYDLLIRKTPEELAEFLGKVTAGGYGMCAPGHYDCTGKELRSVLARLVETGWRVMANCVTCKARCENAGQHRVKTDCISHIPKEHQKPISNADRIRDMTDEELAIHFSATTCPSKEARKKCVTYGQYEDGGCVQCWLDWLRQEGE